MAATKHAIIRYQALDKCLSNFRKRYFIEDLVEACNVALADYGTDVKRRQVIYDLNFMESSLSYDAPIDRIKDGKRTYYRYSDPDYSINKQPLNATEAQHLTDSLVMLSRFKGMPNFEWMDEVIGKLESSFELNNSSAAIVGFDQNIDLKGLKYFSPLFDAIIAKQTLKIKYTPFKKTTQELIVSPYYLKQYNNRWWVFCRTDAQGDSIVNLALDRIDSIKNTKAQFVENENIDFSEYFEDIVGVTHPIGGVEQKVVLKVADDYLGYFITKPIHGSMKKRPGNVFEFKLIPNYELETIILGHADKIKVLEPKSLKETIRKRLNAARKFQEEE